MKPAHHVSDDPSAVRLLQIEPTTRCNYTCGFCWGRHLDQTDIDVSTFLETLDQFPGVEHLELQGEGEPLLHPQFFEMAKLATDRGIAVSTITNGSLFNRGRIDALLGCGIGSILVSIESPDPDEFRKIRGGKLENVIAGIRALLEARNEAGRSHPRLGFTVTVLKDTEHRLAEIVDLYRELKMDGGIIVQMLNPMDGYAQFYSEEMSGQLLSPMGQALAWSRYGRLAEKKDHRESEPEHFWAELVPPESGASAGRRAPNHRSCPWLDQALYVNRAGFVTTCPYVKETAQHALGRIGHDSVNEIVHARNELGRMLNRGQVPTPCRQCAIAESVSRGQANRKDDRQEDPS